MSVLLLDKTRKINKLIHNLAAEELNCSAVLGQMAGVSLSHCVMVDDKGYVIASVRPEGMDELLDFKGLSVGDCVKNEFKDKLSLISSTRENVNPEIFGLTNNNSASLLIVPVEISGVRFGTFFMYRYSQMYDLDDIILSEYISNILAFILSNELTVKSKEIKGKKKEVVSAFSSLSHGEIIGVIALFDELNHKNKAVNISQIASRCNITRSVLVNAIKKLTSSGVISSKSCGVRGTFIEINNDIVYKEIDTIKKLIDMD